MTASELARSRREAIRAATLGRPFPSYEPLEKFGARVRRRLAIITEETGRDPTEAEVKKVHREEARRQRAAVAGFDVVFAPVKSAALLWALDERPWVRDAVRQAHEDAKNAALDLLEDHAAFTRTGTGGIAQIRTSGPDRGGVRPLRLPRRRPEPAHPRRHLLQGPGHRRQVAGAGRPRPVPDHRRRLRVLQHRVRDRAHRSGWASPSPPGPDTAGEREPVREISGVPFGMIGHFSRRRASIEARYAQLVRDYRREHGHDPSRAACHQLARQANLDTRAGQEAGPLPGPRCAPPGGPR